MSRHVWLTKRFLPATINRAMADYEEAKKGGASLEEALQFMGYAHESETQKGVFGIVRYDRLAKTNHRYRRGKNGSNYLDAGRRMLCQYLRSWLLPAPAISLYTALYDGDLAVFGPLCDVLEEAGLSKLVVFLRGRYVAGKGSDTPVVQP
jgi:hypothetical protein